MELIFKLIALFFLGSIILLGKTQDIQNIPVTIPSFPHLVKPEVTDEKVEVPILKNEEDRGRALEKIDTVMLKVTTNVYVPLEIVSDVEIETTIVDDQEVTIPFTVEVNKKPDKKDYYKLKFSENSIDIDKDGVIDTQIYSTRYINSKLLDSNYVNIKGAGISNEGSFYKKVYLTIEVE